MHWHKNIRLVAEQGEVWTQHLGLSVCPWPSRGIFELESPRGQLPDLLLNPGADSKETHSLSSLCLPSSVSFHSSQPQRTLIRNSGVPEEPWGPPTAAPSAKYPCTHQFDFPPPLLEIQGAATTTVTPWILCLLPPLRSRPHPFWMHRWIDPWGVLVQCAEEILQFAFGCSVSCKLKET